MSLEAQVIMSRLTKMDQFQVRPAAEHNWSEIIGDLAALADRMLEMGDRSAAERLVTAIFLMGDLAAAAASSRHPNLGTCAAC